MTVSRQKRGGEDRNRISIAIAADLYTAMVHQVFIAVKIR